MAAPSIASRRRVRQLVHFRVAAPITLFCLTFALYLATLTQVHTFDALSYVTSVERKPWTEIFHPHHLAYGPLGKLALLVGQALGLGGAALPMQTVNALAGALGTTYLAVLVQRVTRRGDLALTAAVLLGSAYAYWYYAVEIEVYTVATLFLLVCLDLLLRLLVRPTLRLWVLLGVAQGGAILFHQTNVLFCVPVLACAVHSGTMQPWARRVRDWLAYSLALALTVGLPYLFVGVVVSGFRSSAAFVAWLTEYTRTGWWGGPITAAKWADLGAGLADTLAQPGGALLWLLLLGLLVLHLRTLFRASPALLQILLAWLLTYGAFFLWWEPDNIEFWIASLPPALLLLALALRGAPRWGPGVWIALAVATTALGLNYDAIQRRGDAATDLQRVVAGTLAAQSTPADLLLVPDGLLELYLPYYERHDNFLSLNQALFDQAGSWEAACAAVQEHIAAARHAGATALIANEVLHPPAELLRRHQLDQAQVTACFAPYQAELLPLAMPPAAPSYWRLPRGQELAQGAGWSFARSAEGWQAANVRDSSFDNGWQFTPAVDPSLTSPLLELDASRYAALELRLANGTQAHDAQLFYAGPDGLIDERRSLRWTLDPTDAPTTYVLDLRDAPGWQGTITRLRLDPVGVGDGGTIMLESVRLIEP